MCLHTVLSGNNLTLRSRSERVPERGPNAFRNAFQTRSKMRSERVPERVLERVPLSRTRSERVPQRDSLHWQLFHQTISVAVRKSPKGGRAISVIL